MKLTLFLAALAVGSASVAAGAQQTSQVQLKIDSTNRTLAVSAEERVTADPEIAVLHIGYETRPMDAKAAYAAGAKTSNEIVGALKQAGIPETSIRSETQHLQSEYGGSHKFKLVQQWTVKAPPERVAEILDIAVSAGATQSGDIDWTVKDEKALEKQALSQAAERAREDAAVLAKGMDARLGRLLYVTNRISAPLEPFGLNGRNFASLATVEVSSGRATGGPTPALPIEPRKVSRIATVYAVFAIE